MITYIVETWHNGRKTESVEFGEYDSDKAIAFWVNLTETVDTDVEVRLVSPAC
jgi:hypothetical protein